MLGYNPPAYVLGIVRTGQPLSLINSFETPVKASNGYIEPSIAAMESHYDRLKKTYGLEGFELKIPEENLNTFCERILSHV